MKTRLLFILAVLLTVSMQAQIPTLVDKNFTLIKKSEGKSVKKAAEVLDELQKNAKDNIEAKIQTIENNKKNIKDTQAGIAVKELQNRENAKRMTELNYEIAMKRNAITLNKSIISSNEAVIKTNNDKVVSLENQIGSHDFLNIENLPKSVSKLVGEKSKLLSDSKKFTLTNAELKTANSMMEVEEKNLSEAIEKSKKEIIETSYSIQNSYKDIENYQSAIAQSESEVAKSEAKLKVIEEISNNPAVKPNPVLYANTLDMYKEYFRLKKDSIAKEVVKKKTTEINGVTHNTDLDNLKSEIKTLKKLNREMDRSLRFAESEETGVFMPSLNHQFGSVFFKKFYYTDGKATNYLNTLSLNYSNSGALAQSEVLADVFGPVRIGFGTLIQSNSETPETPEEEEEQQEEDQLENLINGGGNFYMETILPAFLYSLEDFSTYLYINNKTGMGLKGFSDSVDTSTFNSAFGVNLYVGANTAEKKFNFFINADANYNIGSKEVYENLNLKDKKPFLTAKFSAGITFDQKFRLSAIFNTFGSDESLRSGKVSVGLQIIPSKK